jgi:hypothetical protein
LLGPIYRTLEWMGLLATSQFHFLVSRVKVSHVLVFLATIKRGGGRAVTSADRLYSCCFLIEKPMFFTHMCCSLFEFDLIWI